MYFLDAPLDQGGSSSIQTTASLQGSSQCSPEGCLDEVPPAHCKRSLPKVGGVAWVRAPGGGRLYPVLARAARLSSVCWVAQASTTSSTARPLHLETWSKPLVQLSSARIRMPYHLYITPLPRVLTMAHVSVWLRGISKRLCKTIE